jgi:putative NADH-flavin reductase
MRITVFGSTSRTGRHVLSQGLRRGHEITAFTRRPHTLDDPSALAAVVHGDARDPVVVSRAVEGAEAVITIINGGTRKDPHRYADACRTITQAMTESGVKRLVVTSAYPIVATEPRLVMALLRRLLATPYADLAAMEEIVSTGCLEWTIVRLNRLTNAPASGHVIVSPGLLAKARPISRADVAATLLDLVQDAAMARCAVNVGGGFHGDANGSGLSRHTGEYNPRTHRVGGV